MKIKFFIHLPNLVLQCQWSLEERKVHIWTRIDLNSDAECAGAVWNDQPEYASVLHVTPTL